MSTRARARTWTLAQLDRSQDWSLWWNALDRRWEVTAMSSPGAPRDPVAPARVEVAERPDAAAVSGRGRHRA